MPSHFQLNWCPIWSQVRITKPQEVFQWIRLTFGIDRANGCCQTNTILYVQKSIFFELIVDKKFFSKRLCIGLWMGRNGSGAIELIPRRTHSFSLETIAVAHQKKLIYKLSFHNEIPCIVYQRSINSKYR